MAKKTEKKETKTSTRSKSIKFTVSDGQKKGLMFLLFLGIGMAAIATVWGIVATVNTGLQPTPTPGGFKIEFVDGMTGEMLPSSNVSYELWNVKSIDDWASAVKVKAGMNTSKIVVANFAKNSTVEGDFWVLKYKLLTTGLPYDYYERQTTLVTNQTNRLSLFQEPSATAAFVFASDSAFGVLNVGAGELNNSINFTLMAYTSKAEPNATWVKGPMYQDTEISNAPAWIVEFNETVGLTDLTIANCFTPIRLNNTALRYEFYMLGSATADFDCKITDGLTIGINGLKLVYGPETKLLKAID